MPSNTTGKCLYQVSFSKHNYLLQTIASKGLSSAPMCLVGALENLQKHPALWKFALNGVVQYTRFVGHLRSDVLLPQLLEQTNPDVPPDVLPLGIVEFLSLALNIKQEFIQDSWDILKYYVWEC